MIRYELIPPAITKSLDAYASTGRPTGGCLRAILANDLFEAVGRADEGTQDALASIVSYVYNELPSDCHGSYEKVDAWRDRFSAGPVAPRAPTDTP
jgi:hypothetical protein